MANYGWTRLLFLRPFIPLLNLDQWSVFISLFIVKYSNLVAVFTNPHIRVRVPNFFFKSCFLYLRPILWQTVIFAWELARYVIRRWVVDNLINKTPRWWNIVRGFMFLKRPWSLALLAVHDILSLTSPDNIDAAFSARVKIRYRWQPSQE